MPSPWELHCCPLQGNAQDSVYQRGRAQGIDTLTCSHAQVLELSFLTADSTGACTAADPATGVAAQGDAVRLQHVRISPCRASDVKVGAYLHLSAGALLPCRRRWGVLDAWTALQAHWGVRACQS